MCTHPSPAIFISNAVLLPGLQNKFSTSLCPFLQHFIDVVSFLLCAVVPNFTKAEQISNMAVSLTVPQVPLLFDASPESLLAAAEERKQRAFQAVDQVVTKNSPSTASFKTTILPLIEAENERIHNDPPISFYSQVSPSEHVRNVSRAAEKLLSDGMVELMGRPDLSDLVTAVLDNPAEIDALDPESKIYLSRLRYTQLENGFGIPAGSQRDRYQNVQKRIGHLKIEINRILSSAEEGIWLTRDDLQGLAENTLNKLQKGEPDKLWVQLGSPAASSIRSDVLKASTRRLVYIKDAQRFPENVTLMRELFLLRDEAARLLGYTTNAAFRLRPNLVSSPGEVMDFLEELHRNLAAQIETSIQELVEVKREYFQAAPLEQESWDDESKIFLWDVSFYRRFYQKEKFQFDENKMREYFPLEHTVPQMLGLLGSLFHIRFEMVETSGPEVLVWHDDVQMYRVWCEEQEGGSFMGYFYYDLYKRPGKNNSCVAFSLQKVRTSVRSN
jgi:metallopeptidase MepB